MLTRTQRILKSALAKSETPTNHLPSEPKKLKLEETLLQKPLENNGLFLPTYETTKGLRQYDKEAAIEGFYNKKLNAISPINLSKSDSDGKTSGSEYIPSTPSSSDKESFRNSNIKDKHIFSDHNKILKQNLSNLELNSKKGIKILQNVRLSPVKTRLSQQNVENLYQFCDEGKKIVMAKYLNNIPKEKNMNIRNNFIMPEISANLKEQNKWKDVRSSKLRNHLPMEEENSIFQPMCKDRHFSLIHNSEEKHSLVENVGQVIVEINKSTEYIKIKSGEDSLKEEKQWEYVGSSNTPQGENDKIIAHPIGNEDDTYVFCKYEEKELSTESLGQTTEKSHKSCDIFRENVNSDNIEIIAASRRQGKRVRNKKHVCYFCNKTVIHMGRHYETVHEQETELAKYLSFPKKSKERSQGFAEITRIGDFFHNCNVMSTNNGELILIRRPTVHEVKFVKWSDYRPCPNCLGFLLKKHIWHHMKHTCTEKNKLKCSDTVPKHAIAESNALMADIFGLGFTKDFNDSVVANFKSDKIGEQCRNDILILKFGAMQFEKYGNTQKDMIRQTMRQLARLTLALTDLSNNNIKSLSSFLLPDKFDLVVQATKIISQNMTVDNTKRPELGVPSLALKIGHALRKCVSIERGAALRSGNIKKNELLISFLNLMDMEWTIRISSNALSTLSRRKISAAQLLPLTSDLVKLSNYIDSSIKEAKQNLIDNASNQTWTRLATLVLSRIILFNKRRSGEAARIRMSDYISRPSWENQNTEELKESLTPIEKRLAETLVVVEIEGKRGKKVPIILNPLLKKSIDLLIRHRDESRIGLNNKYIFARSNDSLGYLRGHDCLKKICSEIVLENPSLITGTKLRKYVATVCQLFNMSENEYDWLARHLGHDIKVHREFYRLHESAVELTKVSRLLLAVDRGEVRKFAGKHIEDIDIEDLPYLEEENDNEDKEENENINQEQKEEIERNESRDVDKNKKKNLTKGKNNKRQPWSTDEKTCVFEFFKLSIKKEIVPGKVKCLECIEEYSLNRTWTDVKFCVKNQITKIKKIINAK